MWFKTSGKKYLNDIVQSFTVASVISDENGRVHAVNSKAEKLLNVGRSQLETNGVEYYLKTKGLNILG